MLSADEDGVEGSEEDDVDVDVVVVGVAVNHDDNHDVIPLTCCVTASAVALGSVAVTCALA